MDMTFEEFDALFDTFQISAFHLETHQTYAVSEEDERLRAFREGLPRPERSIRTSPWLRRIALTTAVGKQWSRVHLIREPLSDYLRYQLIGYVESQAVGEEIRLASLDNRPELAELGPDSWLFDAGTPGASGVLLRFDPSGNPLGIAAVEQGAVSEVERQREVALRYSVSLADYLISHTVA